MFFLNLTAAEFFTLLGVLGSAITALYFLDRSRRRKVVSTLQFWAGAATASEQRSRKKVNQPWSLLLQLVSLLLLLLAIAQLQWGTRPVAGRDHVLLLDTSAWSSARLPSGTVLASEVRMANEYLQSLPTQDRVLLARADGLTTPVTTFTADREQTRTALRAIVPSFSALDLPGAFAFAEQARQWAGVNSGEIVYVGPQRVGRSAVPLHAPAHTRLLAVPVDGVNAGIRAVNVRRSETDSTSWIAEITIANYSATPLTVRLLNQFAGTRFAPRTLRLPPNGENRAEYNFSTNTGGQLSSTLEVANDVLPGDNSAALTLPSNGKLAVTVYTARPALLAPLLNASGRLLPSFLPPSAVNNKVSSGLVIFDGVPGPAQISVPAIWINPPARGTPFAVKSAVTNAAIDDWNPSLPVSAGLHAHEEHIPRGSIFSTQPGDAVLASLKSAGTSGPAVVLRQTGGGSKAAAIGFDPLESHLRFTVTTPLLFANLLEWISAEALQTVDLKASVVGSAAVPLEPDEREGNFRVTSETGVNLPFTVHDSLLQLYVNKQTVVHISSVSRERVLSLTLPDLADAIWTPDAAEIVKGFPSAGREFASPIDLWQWLACLGAIGLVAEWLLFGKPRSYKGLPRKGASSAKALPAEREKELVAR